MYNIQFHHKGFCAETKYIRIIKPLATPVTKRRVDLESLLVLPINILTLFYVTEK